MRGEKNKKRIEASDLVENVGCVCVSEFGSGPMTVEMCQSMCLGSCQMAVCLGFGKTLMQRLFTMCTCILCKKDPSEVWRLGLPVSHYSNRPENLEAFPSLTLSMAASTTSSSSVGSTKKARSHDINVTVTQSIDPEKVQQELEKDDWLFHEGNVEELENSPYPEVRASVTLDIDMHVKLNHWRTWFLTIAFVIVFSGVNVFFSLRYPSLSIGFIVAQVVSYPIGRGLALLPNYKPSFLPDFFQLNPGPYSKQEHALLTIVVSLTTSTSYAMNILNAQTNFYNQDLNVGYMILLVFSTQLLGYGAAGLTRRWIVYPASMIWPQTLVTTSLFNTLHSNKNDVLNTMKANGWSMSRYKFFVLVSGFSFVFYWLPGYLFKSLSYFNFICWIWPKNIVVNQLFGVESGLGIIPISFDWTQATQATNTSPLATPAWVSANTYASVFIFYILLLPILYYTNTMYAKYMPMMSTTTYDNTAKKYNVSRVLTKDLVFNKEGYKAYSPLFVPFSYLLSYALNFAAVIAIFVHCALYHGKDIVRKLKDQRHGGEDIHKRLMNNFKEAPDWWYLVLLAVSIVLSFVTICKFETQLPWWGLIIALLIAFLNFIPQGLLEGITNQHVGLNIITELVAGYIWPGKPIANMMFKLYGFIPMRQGLDFSRDLKIAQYMKIRPRILFAAQIVGTLVSCLVNVGVQQWMRFHIHDICSPTQSDGFTCANGRTVFNASIIWGAVGPGKLFSPGKRYNAFMYFFLIGFFAPIVTFFVKKRFPKHWVGKINAPVFFTGPGNIPPSTVYNYSLYFIVSYGFNHYIRKWYRLFHMKYTFILSAALDSGVSIAAVLIFLCVSYPTGSLSWWGNNVYKNTYDDAYKSYYKLGKNETFGPTTW